jgi:hypothetical protein
MRLHCNVAPRQEVLRKEGLGIFNTILQQPPMYPRPRKRSTAVNRASFTPNPIVTPQHPKFVDYPRYVAMEKKYKGA